MKLSLLLVITEVHLVNFVIILGICRSLARLLYEMHAWDVL